jgi:hypothetical protein
MEVDLYRIWLGPRPWCGEGPEFMSHTFYEYQMQEMTDYTRYLMGLTNVLGTPYVVFTEVIADGAIVLTHVNT